MSSYLLSLYFMLSNFVSLTISLLLYVLYEVQHTSLELFAWLTYLFLGIFPLPQHGYNYNNIHIYVYVPLILSHRTGHS